MVEKDALCRFEFASPEVEAGVARLATIRSRAHHPEEDAFRIGTARTMKERGSATRARMTIRGTADLARFDCRATVAIRVSQVCLTLGHQKGPMKGVMSRKRGASGKYPNCTGEGQYGAWNSPSAAKKGLRAKQQARNDSVILLEERMGKCGRVA